MICDFHTHHLHPGERALLSASLPCDAPLYTLEYHPWHLPEKFCGLPDSLRQGLPGAAALGEIGLDALRGPGLPCQRRYLKALLALAEEFHKPVVLHVVRAFPEAWKELEAFHGKVLWHGFRGKPELLQKLLQRGDWVSLSPAALRSPRLCAALKEEKGRIGFETDDDKNLTAAAVLAEAVRLLDRQDLEECTTRNFEEFLS